MALRAGIHTPTSSIRCVYHHFGHATYRGPDARRLLASLLARWNWTGASASLVGAAVAEVEQRPAAVQLRDIAGRAADLWAADAAAQAAFDADPWTSEEHRPKNRAGLVHLSSVRRLALEMALHEDSEQRALEGDLAELEAAWREAEEIASIADDLHAA